MRVVFDHRKDEAPNIYTFYFKPENPVRYTAGQYIELTLPHKNHDNRGQKRWFTLSSSPTDSLLSITTKFSKDRSSTFKQHLRNLKPKQELHMSEPMGDFVLPKIVQTPLLFVAGGIGITPYHSILSWLISVKETRPIDLLYGVNNEEEIIFQDTFSKANQHVTIMVNEPSSSWGGERGRLSAEFILGVGQPTKDTLIYISGPEPMVQALSASLVEKGIDRQKLVVDEFPNYTINY